MTRLRLVAVVAIILLGACGDDDPLAPSSDPDDWSDDQLLSVVYARSWHPEGFYREDRSLGPPYYENTVSIGQSDCPAGDCWFELATDDDEQAAAWSEASSLNSSVYRTLVSTHHTERYFEFRRVADAQPDHVLRSRVHRLSYLDRSAVDRLHPTDTLGVASATPLTAPAVQELVEYMWANSLVVPFGSPLGVRTDADQAAIVCTVLYYRLVGGDWGLCDEVSLRQAVVRVDAATGVMTLSDTLVRTIDGRCY